MKIEIEQDSSGTGLYKWGLETGPERIDCYTGNSNTLGDCFERIIQHRTISAMEYVNE